MTKLPRLTGRELIAALVTAGFNVVRVRGSHRMLRHTDGRTTTVPVHGGEVIGVGLLSRILRDCRLTREELIKLCNN
ncbi:MAG TPA: type II toxin-antitoxin system HicA family toxin [Hyphomicrobiaceae bacterium]